MELNTTKFIRYNARKHSFEVDDRFIGPTSALSTRLLLEGLILSRPYAQGLLLDVGCGTKPYKTFYEVTEHVGIGWPRSGHNLDIQAFANAENLPFVSRSFDTVLCTEVVEYLQQPWLAIHEMARILKPDGILILSAPFVHVLHEEPFDFFRFTPIGLQQLVKVAGFEVVNTWARGGVLSVLITLWCRYLMSFLRRFLNHVPLRQWLAPLLIALLIRWPQRLAAYWLINHRGLGATLFDPSQSLSLGYVLVARRKAD